GSDFDISDLATADYATLTPTLWPQNPRQRGGRFFGEGRFHTPDGRARLIPVTAALPAKPDPAYPFRLNTGRIRDQWHTMTRTGLSPRLSQHLAEPFLEIHPQDAATLGLAPASLAQVSSPHGTAILRVLISPKTAPGHPFAPIHWTGETAPTGRIDALIPSLTDPHSGQPASKSAAVAIRPFAATWYGYAISRANPRPDCDYWAKAPIRGGTQLELAGRSAPDDWRAWASALFGQTPDAEVSDPARGITRMAFTENGRLTAALFIAPQPVLLSRSHLATALDSDSPAILAGQPGADRPDPGPTVCACLNVGLNTILRAITDQQLISVDSIGAALGAGTNCGSCRPELAALLARQPLQTAAE
ncbi:MAG: molybdopterin dinucleotide binding domain-containing protein, partial [Paracoccus sp. (in: a-proteobacteria)]